MDTFPLIVWLTNWLVWLHHARGCAAVKSAMTSEVGSMSTVMLLMCSLLVLKGRRWESIRYETAGTGSGSAGENARKTGTFVVVILTGGQVDTEEKNFPRARHPEHTLDRSTATSRMKNVLVFKDEMAVRKVAPGSS